MCGCKMDSCGTGLETVTGRYKQSNKTSGCTKEAEFRHSLPAISFLRMTLFDALVITFQVLTFVSFQVLEMT